MIFIVTKNRARRKYADDWVVARRRVHHRDTCRARQPLLRLVSQC